MLAGFVVKRVARPALNLDRGVFIVKASVVLDHGMTFLATADSGFTVQMGASPAVGGDNDGPRPLELMLMSLGGCTGMDIISILRKKRQDVSNFEVQLQAGQVKDHPHVFTDIVIKYVVHGRDIKPAAVARAIELSRDKYCPAWAMLKKSVNTIEHSFEIVEEEQEPAV
jgi:putative redox protein